MSRGPDCPLFHIIFPKIFLAQTALEDRDSVSLQSKGQAHSQPITQGRAPSTQGSFPTKQPIICAAISWLSLNHPRHQGLGNQGKNSGTLAPSIAVSNKLPFISNPGA